MNDDLILEVWDDPCPELIALTDELHGRLAAVEQRTRARRADDEVRYRTTLTAIARGVAMIALSRRPPEGLPVPMGTSNYVRSPISITALRTIRDGLRSLGLIAVTAGYFDPLDRTASRYTRLHPSPGFRELCGELLLADLVRPPENPIILRYSNLVGPPPADILASAAVIRRLNDLYAEHELSLPPGHPEPYDPEFRYLYRVFNADYERVGRMYGGFWINLPKAVRRDLLIDGKPVVELDYRTQHPNILFAREGIQLDFDPYNVPGFEHLREAAKRNFNRMLNGDRVPPRWLTDEHAEFPTKPEYLRFIEGLLQNLAPIRHRLATGEGVRLQKLDGDLAISVLERCMDQGIIAYPVHDSFIVKADSFSDVERIMKEAYSDMFEFDIRVSSPISF